MNRIVANKEICSPIEKILTELEQRNFNVIEQILADYHFSEFYFRLVGRNIEFPDNIIVEGVSKEDNKYICDCHWSTVEIEART